MDTIVLHDLCFVPFISAEAISDRTKIIGAKLSESYKDKKPLFVSILSGAFVFAADLIRAFEGDCEVLFVRLASYEGTGSTGKVRTHLGIDKPIEGRHIIIVEDIVDTGNTLKFFLAELERHNVASVCTVALLTKPEALEQPVTVEHVGFEIENKFVVGYGLDYDGIGRNLPDIYQLQNEVGPQGE